MADEASRRSTTAFKSLALSMLYIFISATLINFNKYLMHPSRFPYSTVLTTMHLTVSFASGLVLYTLKPSLYPSMSLVKDQRAKLLKYFTPLAVMFAVGVVCSNEAYLYSGVAFLQFMKQSNILMVFGLSCAVGSQVCDRMKLFGIFWIVFGCTMAVTGEVHFVLLGFAVQLVSQLCECCKNVLQEWLLSGQDFKLDPLTYNLILAPICLPVVCIGNVLAWNIHILPQMAQLWHLLLLNALVAFSLNVMIATLIKHTSAMGYIIAGVAKDIIIVCSSSFVLHEHLSHQQILGFTFATSGIFFWSVMKAAPDHGIVVAVATLLGAPKLEAAQKKMESQPLKASNKV